MNQPSTVNAHGDSAPAELRRSTRIERSIPLIILGQNRMGEPFVERTVSVSLNKHGCRYASRHDYGVGTWVTLQLVDLNGSEEKHPTVRAMVRSIHPPASSRELQQVGVELESPSNVWGIMQPPKDWLGDEKTNTSSAQLPAIVAPPEESATKTVPVSEPVKAPEPKIAQVASFPSPAPAHAPATKKTKPPEPQRVVVTPDGIISAIHGKLQHEAEKAVQSAVGRQVSDVVRKALSSIEDARRSTIQEVQELVPPRIEPVKDSLEEDSVAEVIAQWKTEMDVHRVRTEEMAQRLERQAAELRSELANAREFVDKMTREVPQQVPARLNDAVSQAASDFEGTAVLIMDRRYERLRENVQIVTQEALLKLNARSAEVQALVQTAVNSGLEELRRETELHVNMTLAETKERAASALSSFDAESRASCEARRQALEAEVALSAERATQEFHKGIKVFLYSCLVAAVGAVDEHSRTTLDALLTQDRKTLVDAGRPSPSRDENETANNNNGGPLAH